MAWRPARPGQRIATWSGRSAASRGKAAAMLQVELMRGLSPPDRTAGADHRAGAAEAASFRLAPPPTKAGGGWEGVPTVQADPGAPLPNPPLDRKNVGLGKEMAVRVDLGGRPIFTKKNQH